MAYPNLPGAYVTLRDGNLKTYVPSNEKKILVLGTATSGLTSELYQVSDLGSLIKEFGITSELCKGIAEVKKGGAKDIYAYRLPGTAPSVSGIGVGADYLTDTAGVKITPVQASPEAAAKYGVAYRHAKSYVDSGTGGDSADKSKVVAELMVVNLEDDKVVWQGSALTGAILDEGEVDVEFTLGDVYSGDNASTASEALSFTVTLNTSVSGAGTLTLPISGKTVNVTLGNGNNDATVAAAVKAAVEAALPYIVTYDTVSHVTTYTITANGDTNSSGTLVYPSGHPWEGYTARPFFSAAPNVITSTNVTVAVVEEQDYGAHKLAPDIGLYPQSSTRPFAKVGGGVYVPLDKIQAGGTFVSYGLSGTDFTFQGVEAYYNLNFASIGSVANLFVTGNDGASISRCKRYEKLHTAFEELDLQDFDFVYAVGTTLDAPVSSGAGELGSLGYPEAGTVNDKLGYLAIVDTGNKVFDYFWSDDGETHFCSSTGSAPTGTVVYTEANFAHMIASRMYEFSTDYHHCIAVIGTEKPARLTAAGVRAYFGTAPTYTLDTETGEYFVAESGDNGDGLLGNKFVGGTAEFYDGAKHPGFYATEDGTLDYSSSNIVLDENQAKVDIGKYILVTPIFGTMTNDLNVRGTPYVSNAAPIIAGMLPSLEVTDSLINKVIPGLSINYRLETTMVDIAGSLGLIVAKNENGTAKIADSPTFANPSSDYQRLTTMNIVGDLSQKLRKNTSVFIGKGLSAPRRAALENAISQVLEDAKTGQDPMITSSKFNITQTREQLILGKMVVNITITPVFELRQITFSLGLEV